MGFTLADQSARIPHDEEPVHDQGAKEAEGHEEERHPSRCFVASAHRHTPRRTRPAVRPTATFTTRRPTLPRFTAWTWPSRRAERYRARRTVPTVTVSPPTHGRRRTIWSSSA